MTDEGLYEGREQTLVKHLILRQYVERFAHIIGYYWDSITYIDCFCGPWESQSEELSDTSFAIAIEQLRQAQKNLQDANKQFSIRCLFLEKTRNAYRQLENYARKFEGEIEIATINAKLEDSVSDIVAFVKRGGSTFPFIFIDPTGWTGFALDVIKPLLQLKPGEVLINFMTGHIRRFIEAEQTPTRESFERLFGSGEFRKTLQGLQGQDREDAAVCEYMNQASRVGNYPFASMAMVLHREIAASHFHLIYLTRNPKGMQVFKNAERKAMQEMEKERAKSQQNRRIKKTGQRELFRDQEGAPSDHYVLLRERYLGQAQEAVWNEISQENPVLYDALWAMALRFPMVGEQDLKEWIKNWKTSKQVTVLGLSKKDRVSKLDSNHRITLSNK